MQDILSKISREDLLPEIFNTIRQWPDIERLVFAEAHYHGQSLEAISRTLRLNAEEVGKILKKCDSQLQASLRKLCQSGSGKASPAPDGTAIAAARCII